MSSGNDMTTWNTGYWFLNYNTPAHYALSVHKIMAKKWLSFHNLPTHHVMCVFSFPKIHNDIKEKI